MFAFLDLNRSVVRLVTIMALVLLMGLTIALAVTGHDLAIRADDGYGWGGGSAPADAFGSA
ncbi:hypothetical protein AB0M47_41040 [Hamadaea sp. NPDC051192]|uniref:hypothetical protein n=1 Tax=Hamadaea sp. NPDC051192 TaxID=3154940 RepID=UPI00342A6FBD